MNSYFASCEQQDRPDLRGKPIAVVPVEGTDRTCCIAVSYEAKAFGIKTGCSAIDARKLCPSVALVGSRSQRYIEIHHAILKAVDRVIPVHRVHSVDEFDCRLLGPEREMNRSIEIGQSIKSIIRGEVGEWLRCSVGIAPSAWLGKVASNFVKPDGLSVIQQEDLPSILFGLSLEDLPGIGKGMGRRLAAAGVGSIERLCSLSEQELSTIWGSRIHGSAWWARLRGREVAEPSGRTRSVGHGKTLPPEMRNDADARAILISLIHKACERLRFIGYWAYLLDVYASHLDGPSWSVRTHLAGCQDTLAVVRCFADLWQLRPRLTPIRVGVVLGNLQPNRSVAMPLYHGQQQETALAYSIDRINRRFGRSSVYFAGMHAARNEHATRIAFGHIPNLDLPSG